MAATRICQAPFSTRQHRPWCGGSIAKLPRSIPEEHTLMRQQSDALVFFGATGDLARKQIFPALQALVRRGSIDLPIIGVARASMDLDAFRNFARQSLQEHGGVDEAAFARLAARLH